jgi:hypothetical protein
VPEIGDEEVPRRARAGTRFNARACIGARHGYVTACVRMYSFARQAEPSPTMSSASAVHSAVGFGPAAGDEQGASQREAETRIYARASIRGPRLFRRGVLPIRGSRRLTIAAPGRARAPSGLWRWLSSSSDHSRRARGSLGRSDARDVFRWLRNVSGGESPFASVAVRWPRRASSGRTTATAQGSTGTCRLSPTEGRIAPTEVSCPRRMMVILRLRTAAPRSAPSKAREAV